MEEKKSYYAIIPANVRYDKNIIANAKLLYGEITALCNEKGYCWASNNYFANLYEVTPQAISKWINLLEENKYIKTEYIYNGNEIKQRNIYLEVSTNIDTGINKSLVGYQQKFKDNNIINNTNNINNDNSNYVYIEDQKFNGKTVSEIQEKMNNLRKY